MHSSFAITNTEYLLLLLHFLTKLKDILLPSDISSCMSVDKKPKAKQNQTKNIDVFKGTGGWRSSNVLSLRAMECYYNMIMNMDESSQLTPSQAPMVLISVPILISDNAVMVKQSRTTGLPCHSPSRASSSPLAVCQCQPPPHSLSCSSHPEIQR